MPQEASLFMAGPFCAAWQFPEPLGCKARGGFFPGMLEGGSLTAVCWGGYLCFRRTSQTEVDQLLS